MWETLLGAIIGGFFAIAGGVAAELWHERRIEAHKRRLLDDSLTATLVSLNDFAEGRVMPPEMVLDQRDELLPTDTWTYNRPWLPSQITAAMFSAYRMIALVRWAMTRQTNPTLDPGLADIINRARDQSVAALIQLRAYESSRPFARLRTLFERRHQQDPLAS